jgi:hypothetical protein
MGALRTSVLKVFFCSMVSTILIGFSAHGQELPENWYTARALGMGGAFSSVVDDSTALFYNPAGLDRINDIHVTLLGLNAGTDNLNLNSTYSNISGSNYANVIRQYYGQNLWAVANDYLAISGRGFAFAAYTALVANFYLSNPAFPNASVNVAGDYGASTGFAIPLLPDNVLRLGVVAKRITRYGGQINLTPSSLVSLSNTQITNLINNYGTGYGADAGLLLEMPTGIRPTFSFVWHDIGQTAFIQGGGTSPLAPINNDLVAGLSCLFGGNGFSVRPAFDYEYLNDSANQVGKKIHVGAEFSLANLVFRGGLNQGYWTLGAGVDLKFLKIDAATYGEELETYPGQMEDRRYLVQATIDIDIISSFTFNGKGPSRSAYERR